MLNKEIFRSLVPTTILMMPRMFYRGLILYFCWLWFVVPLFALPIMPLWYAIPLSGLVSILTFEKIGVCHSIQESWVRVGEWALGATVFFIAAFVFHFLSM